MTDEDDEIGGGAEDEPTEGACRDAVAADGSEPQAASAAAARTDSAPNLPAGSQGSTTRSLDAIRRAAEGRIGGSLIGDTATARLMRETTSSRLMRDVETASKRMSDLAMGRTPQSIVDRRLQERSLGIVTGSLSDLAGRFATGNSIGALATSQALAHQQREFERSLGIMGGIDAVMARHTAMGRSIDALGGMDSIMKRHEQMTASFAARSLAETTAAAIAGTSFATSSAVERAMREVSGITSFTGLLGRSAFDRSGLDAMVSGTLAWQRSARSLSLAGTLQSQLPQLFPERRRATADDLRDMALGRIGERFARDRSRLDGVRDEMLRERRAWVEIDRPERSVAAYVEARALANAVEAGPPESRAVVEAVRAELGDYRESAPVPAIVAENPVLRSAFRLEVGFNPDLSSLPPAVLGAIFGFAGRSAPRREVDPDALESVVHQRARRLELRLRRFIERRMIAGCGPKWTKQRVDGKTVQRWRQRRQLDLDNGRRASRLFDYAGFEDYREIIDRTDNWRDVFAAVFPVKTSVLESLRRLSLVRNPDAHYRVMTVDDLLDLTVEARRLDQWMDAADDI